MFRFSKERFRKAKKLWWLLAAFVVFCGIAEWMRFAGFGVAYNRTGSLPKGFYLKWPISFPLNKGMIVEYPMPEDGKKLAISRGWTDGTRLMLKTVAGLPGDQICIDGDRLTINGVPIVEVLRHDVKGLPLPFAEGCYFLEAEQFLPLSSHSKKSFDGRYYGPIHFAEITAQAKPLWLLE